MKRMIVILLAAMLLSLAACGGTKDAWQEQYDLGMRCFKDENYEEAAAAFETAIEIDGSQPKAYLATAEAYVGLGDYVSTIKVLQRCYDATGAASAKERVNDICTQWLVTDAYAYDSDQTISMYNIEKKQSEDIPVAFHIPQINLGSADAEAANREIYDELSPDVQEAITDLDNLYELSCGSIAYRTAVNGDVLSLLIVSSMYPGCSTSYSYRVYNFSLSQGTLLTAEEVAAAAGYTAEDYALRARQAMGSYVREQLQDGVAQGYGELFVQELNQYMERTLSDENVQKTQPYLDEKGDLRLVATLYWPVAGGAFTLPLNLTDFQLVEGYDQKLEMPAPPEPPESEEILLTEDEAKELAYQHWDYTPGDVASETGFALGVSAGEMRQEGEKNYYVFWMRWLVDGTH